MNPLSTNREANPSILSSSPSHGVSKIQISGSSSINADAANNSTTLTTIGLNGSGRNSGVGVGGSSSSSSLMNGNGELVFRRSPVSSAQLTHLNQSYYTLGNPSISTSYNSEEISENIHSSLFDEDGNLNESLSVKVEELQRQVQLLTDLQTSQDDRYRRTKQENDDLLGRIHLLEDQLRELEINSEDRSREEEKRFKETMAKQMKLKSEECEQHLQANYQLQQEIIALQKDLIKSETTIRALKSEKQALEADLSEKTNELNTLDEEIHRLKLLIKQMKDEEHVKSNLINILNEELEENSLHRSHGEQHANLSSSSSSVHHNNNHSHVLSPKQRSSSSRRSSTTSGYGDELSSSQAANVKAQKDFDVLEADLSKLRHDNKVLKDMNEELQAQLLNVQLEEGRSLIQQGDKTYSLADELGDIDVNKLMEALKDQQEANVRLRQYTEKLLSRIMEKDISILRITPE